MTPLDRYNLCLERLCDNTERLHAIDTDSDQWAVMDQTEDLCRQMLAAIAARRREIDHRRALATEADLEADARRGWRDE